MSHATITRTIAALLIISAIFVPAANAQPVDAPGHYVAQSAQAPAPSDPTQTTTASGDFDWGDAAVGAAGMLIVLSVGAAGVATIRRGRGQSHPLLTS